MCTSKHLRVASYKRPIEATFSGKGLAQGIILGTSPHPHLVWVTGPY